MDEGQKWRLVGMATAAVAGLGLFWWLTSPGPKKSQKDSEQGQDSKEGQEQAADVAATASTAAVPTPVVTDDEDVRAREAHRLKSKGNELYAKSQKYAEAAELYTRAIALYPFEDEAKSTFYSNRSACNLHLGLHEAVVEDCTAALALNPSYAKALHRRAQAYEHLKDAHNALLDYVQLSFLKPDEASAQATVRIATQIAQGKTKETIAHKGPGLLSRTAIAQFLDGFYPTEEAEPECSTVLREQVASNASDASLQYRLARALVSEREYGAAIPAVTEAVRLCREDMTSVDSDAVEQRAAADANFIKAAMLRATLLHLNSQPLEAIALYDEILQLDPSNTEARVRRGTALVDANNVQDALVEYDRVISENPQDRNAYYHRGQLRFILGERGPGLEDLKKAVELNDKTAAAGAHLGTVYFACGELKRSQETFASCIKAFPNNVTVRCLFGQTLIESLMILEQQGMLTEQHALGIVQQAQAQFDKALEAQPDSAFALVHKASLCMRTANIAEFHKLTKKAMEVEPDYETSYLQLAEFYLLQNDLEESLKLYSKVIDMARTGDALQQAHHGQILALARIAVMERDPVTRKKVEDETRKAKQRLDEMIHQATMRQQQQAQ